MAAKKKTQKTSSKKKKPHKAPPLPQEEKVQSQEENQPASESLAPTDASDTVVQSPQAISQNPLSDPANPAPPQAQTPVNTSASDSSESPVEPSQQAEATPNTAAPPPQIISTTGQVLPASGTPSQPVPDGSSLPSTTSPAPEQVGQVSPSSFQLDEPGEGNKKNIFFMILLILVVAGLIGIGFVYRKPIMDTISGGLVSPTPTPAPVSQKEEEPTKTPEPKLDTHAIKVLNGSGKAGEASKIKETLAQKGFNIESIGNTDTSDYEETVIQAKSTVSREFLDALKKVLSASYVLDPVDSLSETEEVDVVVIIGSKAVESE